MKKAVTCVGFAYIFIKSVTHSLNMYQGWTTLNSMESLDP